MATIKNIPGFPGVPVNPIIIARWAKWSGQKAGGAVIGNVQRKRQVPAYDPKKTPSAIKIQAAIDAGVKTPSKDINIPDYRKSWLTHKDNPNKWSPDQMGSGVRPNPITIVDYDQYKMGDGKGGKSYSYITLYTVPTEIGFDPQANFVPIASIGRNAPFYHYTGSEDTLTFKLDWYAKQENRVDVIFNCRWLASRSKSDGYYGDPHRLLIIWGDGGLFSTDVWIINKAPYKLTQFQKHQGMLPNQAYQEVEFKKVLDMNSNYADHLGAFTNSVTQPEASTIIYGSDIPSR